MNENQDKNICKIVNGKFSYELHVDGQLILFNGGDNADYFAKHYKELGYHIVLEDKYNA